MKNSKSTFQRTTMHIAASLFLLISMFINQSCAVIAGGSRYYANVVVEGHPKAKISHNGQTKGYGNSTVKLLRKDANNLTFTISEEGCPTVDKTFTKRTFRGWSFVGTLVTWTGLSINGGPWIPIPFGVIVDGSTGAWWKPDVNEVGISKVDYKNYNYNLTYEECNGIEQSGSSVKDKFEDADTNL